MVGQLHGVWRRKWLLAVAVVVVALLSVWTAGQMAGFLIRGSWPHVSLAGSVVELLRVLGGGEPVAGIPTGPFWLSLILELVGFAWLAVRVRRLRMTGRQRTWTPRPALGEPAGAESFEAAYARAVHADRRNW